MVNAVRNRVAEMLATNETPARKGRKQQEEPRGNKKKSDGLVGLSQGMVVFFGGISMYLNCRSIYLTAGEIDSTLFAAAIPLFVMLVFKQASKCFTRFQKAKGKQKTIKAVEAILAALVGFAALGLSLIHCTESIAAMMHSSTSLALPLAITIDCGLVVSEWLTVSCE